MKQIFVETENVDRFYTALTGLQRRGAKEVLIIAVDGKPGRGKTRTMEWWTAQNSLPFLRSCKGWKKSPGWFLNDLVRELGLAPARSTEERYRQTLGELIARRSRAEMENRTFAVVIDEADHFSRIGDIMETIRDLADNGDIPFVLVGMGQLKNNLTKFEQIARRVVRYVTFEPA